MDGPYDRSGYSSDGTNTNIFPFPSLENYDSTSQQDSEFHGRGNYGDKMDKCHLIRWKSGKSVDPRLLTLLNFFRELFVGRREFFEKIFPGIHHEFAELFRKIGTGLSRKEGRKFQTIQRSVSLDFPQDSSLRLERFKVRTPEVISTGAQQGNGHGGAQGGNDGGGKGNTKSNNSK